MTTQLEHRPASGGAPRVVVVGAGFGGLAAAGRLARAGTETTLIDRNVYSTFQPLLYQLATGGLASSDVAYPVRAASRRHGMLFRHGELAGIDPAARQVTLADGATPGYDHLILATGVAAACHGVPGAAEHSLGLYTRHDAIVLRDRIMAELDRISLTGLREDVAVTVIRGGATGVELAGSLADLRGTALPAYFPEIDPARVHITLVEHGPALLAPFRRGRRLSAGDGRPCPKMAAHGDLTCPRLEHGNRWNSPDRGNHAIRVTGAGRPHPAIPRRVRYLFRYLARAWLGSRCRVSVPASLTASRGCRQRQCRAGAQHLGCASRSRLHSVMSGAARTLK